MVRKVRGERRAGGEEEGENWEDKEDEENRRRIWCNLVCSDGESDGS